MRVKIIGGGLAGSEAALQLAKRKIHVDLYEMRPNVETGAHNTAYLAELVCSNSLGGNDTATASGLLKEEMRLLGSELLRIAKDFVVPAGAALAVDRDEFAKAVTEEINKSEYITVHYEEIKSIPTDSPVIMASGPLTSSDLAEDIKKFTGNDHLYFFDAIAPIVEKDSINFDIAYIKSRYDKGEASYINCPMDEEQYKLFYETLINSPKIELKEFEKDAKFFEGCMPVEVIASRGFDTLRFGPMKPVGLEDPKTDKIPYAVVQLRQDNLAATLYNIVGFQTNLKWGAQKELLKCIPGLENANIVRYGVMHRNTFIYSPKVLNQTMQTKKREDLFFAGQITGVEGYTESIATGMLAGINMANYIQDIELLILDTASILGALTSYITFGEHKHFQPINSNWGILKEMDIPKKIRKDKKAKNKILADRAIEYINTINIKI